MPQSIPLPSAVSGITLAEILPPPVHFAGVAAAVESGMAGTLGGKWVRSEPSGAEVEVATSLLQRYQSPEWTWHR
jgi:hypothetical protein